MKYINRDGRAMATANTEQGDVIITQQQFEALKAQNAADYKAFLDNMAAEQAANDAQRQINYMSAKTKLMGLGLTSDECDSLIKFGGM